MAQSSSSQVAPEATGRGPFAVARRVFRSVFPEPVVPRTDRERRRVVVHTLLLHFRPVQLPAATLRYTHTFGLGGSSLVLFLVLAATGLLSLFAYEPSPERAYASVLGLQRDYLFGGLVRSVHHWSAHLMAAVVVLHLLRVFLTGAFRAPRQFNWLVGCALLALVLGSNFTGYLLPWDQLSYWAVTISTSMLLYVPLVGAPLREALLGGDDVGRTTLVIFHALHTTVLPASLAGLMGLHFWRVRKAGGVIVPRPVDGERPRPEQTVLFVPHLLPREVAAGLALLAGVLAFSVALPAPLGAPANPGMSPNPAKAPWYFAGLQEMLVHFHPVFAVLVVPGAAAVALLALPYLHYDEEPSGRWFLSAAGRRSALLAAGLGAGVTTAWVLLDALLAGPGGWLPFLSPVVGKGLLPVALIVAALAAFAGWLRRHVRATRGERVQALFVLLFAAFAVLTLVGTWFRGPGMRLVWPWNA
jgi:quinol-cytochrome oxidoreductase complex cytochrome b subunit